MHKKTDAQATNEELMGRTGLGDRHAFEVLVKRHQRPVLNFIYRFMGNQTDAEGCGFTAAGFSLGNQIQTVKNRRQTLFLNRRHLLRGLAGTALGLPLLECMLDGRAHAAGHQTLGVNRIGSKRGVKLYRSRSKMTRLTASRRRARRPSAEKTRTPPACG